MKFKKIVTEREVRKSYGFFDCFIKCLFDKFSHAIKKINWHTLKKTVWQTNDCKKLWKC